ncbi:hypothetical protein CEXT_652611 [Caerostris extrusa]|uniref:Ubiquinol-cytochrome c chaperone domain-containing protein n=1 Tax=Caerostris extrusa TaxID=172846 RepID=A0AAV4SU16_CAEEX|nr:hypothetical protein CEXT_652611 [Caerostris extrusa]
MLDAVLGGCAATFIRWMRKYRNHPYHIIEKRNKNNKIFRDIKNDNSKFQHVKYFSTSLNFRSSRFISWIKIKLYNLISSSAKTRLGASLTYEKCGDKLNYNEFFKYFDLPDTFNSWFLTIQLHIWMCTVVTVSEKMEVPFATI